MAAGPAMNTKHALFLSLLIGASDSTQLQGAERSNPEKASHPGGSTIIPNRTLPNVSPPKAGLEFSANPTTQEIFRARVFEEPLVPIGGDPTAEENAALAAALLGYAKRSGPDD